MWTFLHRILRPPTRYLQVRQASSIANFFTCTEGSVSVEYSPKVVLSGFEGTGVGTIIIRYDFPCGVQTEGMPSPGKRYTGTSRVAYLPDHTKGREVLHLLLESFRRKQTFCVGTRYSQ
jgi:Deltex C-terminal domain